MAIIDEILSLKEQRRAAILAHNYQLPEVQDIADLTGDSLELARAAARLDCDVLVFCGVDFMAETAAILSPDKTVVLPAKGAWCPMAHMISPQELRDLKALYPEAAVVCYVNSTAEIKAESDICCTSANGVEVVSSLSEKEVIFVPDQESGRLCGPPHRQEGHTLERLLLCARSIHCCRGGGGPGPTSPG